MAAGDALLPVSVVIPFYDGSAYLDRLAAAIRTQGAAEVIVVVDDGRSADVVARALEGVPGLVVLQTAGSVGTANARNVGAAQATQPWVTFLDQDDWWPDRFLARLLPQAGDRTVVSYDNDVELEAADGSIEPSGATVFGEAGFTAREVTARDAARITWGFPMQKLLLSRTLLLRLGGYRNIYAIEDLDLFCRILATGERVGIVHDPRGSYLRRVGSITGMVASGDLQQLVRGNASWIRVWTGVASAGRFPLGVRLRALRWAGVASSRYLRLRVRQTPPGAWAHGVLRSSR